MVMTPELLGDVAEEHVLMENSHTIAVMARSLRASDVYVDDGSPHLQSLIQREGQKVYSWNDPGNIVPEWVARAASETLNTADLRVLPTGHDPENAVLYRRVTKDYLSSEESIRWRPISSLKGVYRKNRRGQAVEGVDSWIKDALIRADLTISRAMTFECTDGLFRFEYDPVSREWYRTIQNNAGGVKTEKGTNPHPNRRGEIVYDVVNVAPRVDTKPTTYSVRTNCTLQEAYALGKQARQYLSQWVQSDQKSLTNITLMPAAPFMRSHPEQAYVLQGPGGTGKSTFAKDLLAHLGDQAMTLSLDLLSQPTAMSAENAMVNLTEHVLALSDDYDPRFGRFTKALPHLKTLLTGLLPFSARRQGENSMSGIPQAVHVLTTNYHLPIGENEAEQRRFAFATMWSNKPLAQYREFVGRYGFWPFMFTSALMWVQRQGLHCKGVAYMDEETLTDAEVEAVKTAIAEGVVAPVPGMRVDWKGIGMVRTATRKGFDDNKPHPAYKPADKDSPLYDVWMAAKHAVQAIPELDQAAPVPDGSDVGDITTVDDWLEALQEAHPQVFPCLPENKGKAKAKAPDTAALQRATGKTSWQQAVQDPELKLDHTYDNTVSCWGLTVDSNYMFFDFDQHHDGETGWVLFQKEVDMYGSERFPHTFTSLTPSGGVHALYKIPAGVKLKSRADGSKQVDLRIGGKGYVIAACSTTADGVYKPSDRPSGGRIPELTEAMVAWLDRNGYTEKEVTPSVSPSFTSISRPHDNSGSPVPGTSVRIHPPVMSQHNTHDAWVAWCYGIAKRAVEQHWDNATVTNVFRYGMSFVPASHDRQDTVRCIADACQKAGIVIPTVN